jgi:plastocyanin
MRPLTLLAATTVALLACGGDDGSNEPNPPSGDIAVGNNVFNPQNFSTTAGSTVTWAWNSGSVTHNVTFDDGVTAGSGNKSSGTFEQTFAAPGSYPYHCSIHGAPGSGMFGVVNVTAGSTGDAGGSTGGGSTGGGSSGGGTGGSGMGGGGYGGSPY